MKTQTTFQNFDLNKIPEDLYIPKDAFKLTLESFSGPMDLLLYLIHKKDVDILDINVAEITDQYVSYIDLMEALQIEIASDYLVMAATFNSFIHPFIIILTVPLAIFGGLVFILFLNSSVNIFSQIALIILIGISTKNLWYQTLLMGDLI